MVRRWWLFLCVAVAPFSGCSGDEFTSGGGAASCGLEQKPCGDSCVARDRPEYGCGQAACEACVVPKASPKCEAGLCAIGQCLGTFADCDGDAPNGCEVNLNSSDNCGTCGLRCPDGQVCNGAVCADDCGGLIECNGGCVDILTDIAHCGGCDQPCDVSAGSGTPQCIQGACIYDCGPGFDNCESSSPDCETSIETDPANCGACGVSCPPAPPGATALGCNAGNCECSGGLTACSDAGGAVCIDVTSEPQACGGCNTKCSHGQWCSGSSCAGPPACAFGQTSCDSVCVDTKSDPNNCGTCGNECGTTLVCKDGSCKVATECLSPYETCGAAFNACPNTKLDTDHCGGCNQKCGLGQTCLLGVCEPLTLTNAAWYCTLLGTAACLVPSSWPEPPAASYFCATQCPWGQAS